MSSRKQKKTIRARPQRGLLAGRVLLSREDWIAAARVELVAGGVNAVTIGRLGDRLAVTRGGFYWHFKGRPALLHDLLEFWERTNTVPFERVLANDHSRNGIAEFLAVMNLWLDEETYDPAFDTAVRDWARTSKEAAAAVRRVDERRIEVLHRIFRDLGFTDPEALVRARITYFHQVGYYALQIQEEGARRRELASLYAHVLTGVPVEDLRKAIRLSTKAAR